MMLLFQYVLHINELLYHTLMLWHKYYSWLVGSKENKATNVDCYCHQCRLFCFLPVHSIYIDANTAIVSLEQDVEVESQEQ